MLVRKGDIIVLNDRHKLVCGDSTDINSYKYLTDIATITLTSPPYNFDTKDGNNITKKYIVDEKLDDDAYTKMCQSVLDNCLDKSRYVFWNVSQISNNKKSLTKFTCNNIDALCDTMIWHKTTSNPAMQRRVLNSDFEYVYIYTKKEKATRLINVGKDFRGTISNVIYCNRNFKNNYSKIHSALMSEDLAVYLVDKFSLTNDIVLDCFCGLGTTLIACEKLNRTGYGIELLPFYCEATIDRFSKSGLLKNVYIIRDDEIIDMDSILNYLETCDFKNNEQKTSDEVVSKLW